MLVSWVVINKSAKKPNKPPTALPTPKTPTKIKQKHPGQEQRRVTHKELALNSPSVKQLPLRLPKAEYHSVHINSL